MARIQNTPAATRNLALNAAYDPCNSGYLRFYTDSGKGTLLAEGRFAATAFAAASAASKGANTLGTAPAISASGVCGWCAFYKSDGTTLVDEGNVNTSDGFCVVANTTFTSGGNVTISSITLTQAT